MDIVLGVSMAPTAVRLVLVEGQNADGVTVEQDHFEVVAREDSETSDSADQVIAAIFGTREGAAEGGYQLTSTGVTWTDPAEVAALRDELAARDIGGVMLVSPLLAAAALAQSVGDALGYEHIAMLFVEPESATLAVVEIADGSIVDLHRRLLVRAGAGVRDGAVAAELAVMVAGLDAPGSRADGVFIVGCGVDIVGIKTALEAATALYVSGPEEPEMALARGAALASANAPLFASSTAALAYALDPGTGEVNPRALSPTYLDVCGNAALGAGALAYSVPDDDVDDEGPKSVHRRGPSILVGSALAGILAVVAGVVVVSLTSDTRQAPAPQPKPPTGAVAWVNPVPPPQAQLPAPSSPPPAPVPAVAAPPEPAPAVAAPPAPPVPAPVAQQTPHSVVDMPPATPPRRAPARRAPESVPTPVQQAPAPTPAAPPPEPAAPPPEPAAVPAPPPQYQQPARPPMTVYLHFPFVTVPIPITPPPPPAPPPAP